MNFLELAAKRQSVRKFAADPVSDDDLRYCIEAARLAPSACNAQPWSFVAVRDPALRERAELACFDAAASFNRFATGAPAFIAVVMEKANWSSRLGSAFKGRDYRPFDIGLAVSQLCLAAADRGLGTCILGWYNERKIKELLGIPRSKEVALVVLLGKPESQDIRPKQRKPLGDVLHLETYLDGKAE
jgi:nitroreductase